MHLIYFITTLLLYNLIKQHYLLPHISENDIKEHEFIQLVSPIPETELFCVI